MAALEPYYFEPDMLQTLFLLCVFIVNLKGCFEFTIKTHNKKRVCEVDNHLEKIDFADLVKDARSVAGFSPSCQFGVGRNDVT